MEHLTNPGLALETVRSYILKTNLDSEVILTAPNYHNLWQHVVSGLQNKELLHPEHNVNFSYRTFRNLIEQYNFEADDFCFTYYYKYPESIKRVIVYKFLSQIAPCMAPYLFFKCRIVRGTK